MGFRLVFKVRVPDITASVTGACVSWCGFPAILGPTIVPMCWIFQYLGDEMSDKVHMVEKHWSLDNM